MSLIEKTEFPFFEFPIFRYCRNALLPCPVLEPLSVALRVSSKLLPSWRREQEVRLKSSDISIKRQEQQGFFLRVSKVVYVQLLQGTR